MDRTSAIQAKLGKKREMTEEKIRGLQREGKAGKRYTAMIADLPFLVLGLLCDVGWLLQLIAGARYLWKAGFRGGQPLGLVLDGACLAAWVAVVFGIGVIIYLNRIHEKEIATRWQKNAGFGATVFGGLVAGIAGLWQCGLALSHGLPGNGFLLAMALGGLWSFAFGLPIFASFRRGIVYRHGA